MLDRRRTTVLPALLVAACLVSCYSRRPTPRPLPAIPVYVIAPTDTGGVTLVLAPPSSRDPLTELGAVKRVSLTANNADAKTLLLWLARESGVSLVVAPDVTGRVSVTFNNVPAHEAMRAIIAEAGLSLLTTGLQHPWPPVVFHDPPVNINDADVDALMARFGVSLEMAKWIVESRPRP
jgi:hypothetical protein